MLKIAIPNKGALSEGAVQILKDAGYRCHRWGKELTVLDRSHETEFIFLRPRDIAVYVGNGILDAGITGLDLAADSGAQVKTVLPLGIGKSRFFYAVPATEEVGVEQLEGRRIATSYAHLVQQDLQRRGIRAEVIRLDGAIEISIRLGVADAIADVVESGQTLREAGLKTIGEPIMSSEAAVVAPPGRENNEELRLFLQRLEGILVAREFCLLEYVVSKSAREEACAITPGVKSPTISPVENEAWVAISAMVKRKGLNLTIDRLAALGATGIIAHNIQTCRL
jgi:ATP phosphoribosyltransferase